MVEITTPVLRFSQLRDEVEEDEEENDSEDEEERLRRK